MSAVSYRQYRQLALSSAVPALIGQPILISTVEASLIWKLRPNRPPDFDLLASLTRLDMTRGQDRTVLRPWMRQGNGEEGTKTGNWQGYTGKRLQKNSCAVAGKVVTKARCFSFFLCCCCCCCFFSFMNLGVFCSFLFCFVLFLFVVLPSFCLGMLLYGNTRAWP